MICQYLAWIIVKNVSQVVTRSNKFLYYQMGVTINNRGRITLYVSFRFAVRRVCHILYITDIYMSFWVFTVVDLLCLSMHLISVLYSVTNREIEKQWISMIRRVAWLKRLINHHALITVPYVAFSFLWLKSESFVSQ